MVGGGVVGDFVDWVKGLFGSSAEKYIASNKFDPSDISKAQGILSQKMLEELNESLNMNMTKKGSAAKQFVDKMIDGDNAIESGEKV